MEYSQLDNDQNVVSQDSNETERYRDWEFVKTVGQGFQQYHQEFILICIPTFTDYDSLQEFETNVFDAVDKHRDFMEKEILSRNKTITEIEKQVGVIKSYTQNSNGFLLGISQKLQQIRAEENQNAINELNRKTNQLENEIKEIKNFQNELQKNNYQFQQQVAMKKKQLFKGLSTEKIQQFSQFTAYESFVGNQCAICMEDIETGRNMMRLDCDGKHTFCQVCIEGWFAKHNTCPICRHTFE